MTDDQLLQLPPALDVLCDVAHRLQQCIRRTHLPAGTPGGQCGETAILDEVLLGDGCYVDIGASAPVECSNTWGLYQRGWRGLLVEPLPWCLPALTRQRTGDFVYPVAAMDYDGFARLRVCGSVSSTMPWWNIAECGDLLVECETLATMLARFPAIRDNCRLCSIDVEGAEGLVLLGNDWGTFHPEVFVVEYREYDPHALGKDLSGNWSHLLTDHGYHKVCRTDLNLIYSNKP